MAMKRWHFLMSDWKGWERRGCGWRSASPHPQFRPDENASMSYVAWHLVNERLWRWEWVTENVKLISFAREWRAHRELNGMEHLRGVRRVAGRKQWEGVVGKSSTETLRWPSCKSVKDFLALSHGNSRKKWKYVEMCKTHGPVTWISILLTGASAREFCFGPWKVSKTAKRKWYFML